MSKYATKKEQHQSRAIANNLPVQKSAEKSTLQLIDNRPIAVAQRKLQEIANNSQQVKQLSAIQTSVNNNQFFNQTTIQRQPVALSDGTDDEFAQGAAVGAITPGSIRVMPRRAGAENLYIFDYTSRHGCQIHIHEEVAEDEITAAHIKSQDRRPTPRGPQELRHSIDLFLARRMVDSIPGRQPVGNS